MTAAELADRPQVYLAGAIDRVPVSLARGWRDAARRRVTRLGCGALDPMRDGPATDDPLIDAETIVRHDEAMLRSADAVLAELVFAAPHYGTALEIEQAVSLGIPVVVWTGGERVPVYLARHGGGAVTFAGAFEDAVTLAAEAAKRGWRRGNGEGTERRGGLRMVRAPTAVE